MILKVMKMIDLHIHTSYSDGKYTVCEILNMAEKMGLNIISITDHDCCKAYYELEEENIRNLFKGEIKTGIEITTSYGGTRIELLAYDFDDYKTINDFFVNATNNISWEPIMIEERKILLQKIKNLGLKYDSIFDEELLIDRYETKLYTSILELNAKDVLKNLLADYFCETGREFYRKCIANPNSPFYANYGKYRPKIEQIISLIHSHGGIVLLAHPYGYRLNNTEEYIEKLYNEYDLDGIECYYNGFNEEQIKYIENFARKRNLLISGGSDFHGTEDRDNELGKCKLGTEFIPDKIIENWGHENIAKKT